MRFGVFLAAVSHGLGTISLFLVGSKSNVSGFFRLQFRNGLGTKPAGALPFRMRSPSTFFLGFATFREFGPGVYQASKSYVAQRFSLFEATWTFREFGHGVAFRHFSGCGFARLGHDFFVFSGFQKQRFEIFKAAVSQWLGHKTCWGSAFSDALPKHLFLGSFGIFLAAVSHGLGSFAWLGHDFFVFSGFQKRRFGIFQAAVSQWLGHKTCWGSAFSDALPKHLFLGFCHVSGVWARSRYQASKSYVAQRFSLFEATWTVREFGHGVAFRHFSGCGFAWLGHDFFVFSGFQKRRFGIFQAAVSQWLGHKTCWGSAFSDALPKHLFLGFCHVSGVWARSRYQASKSYVAQRFSLFEATWTFREFGHGVAFRRFSGCGFAWLGHDYFVFSGFQKQRFGIFQAAVSQWLGHKTCWGSAFSDALPKHLFLGFCHVSGVWV